LPYIAVLITIIVMSLLRLSSGCPRMKTGSSEGKHEAQGEPAGTPTERCNPESRTRWRRTPGKKKGGVKKKEDTVAMKIACRCYPRGA
jgi:hypothetical protein